MQAQSYLTLVTLLWIVHFILFAVATPIATVNVCSISQEAWPWLENKTANHNRSLGAVFFKSLQLSFDHHAKNSLPEQCSIIKFFNSTKQNEWFTDGYIVGNASKFSFVSQPTQNLLKSRCLKPTLLNCLILITFNPSFTQRNIRFPW